MVDSLGIIYSDIESPDDVIEYLAIDKYNIVGELSVQQFLVERVNAKAALAISERDAQKEVMRVVEANVALELKSNGEKATEATIKAKVDVDKRVIETRRDYVEKSHKAREWDVKVKAVESRGYALAGLKDIWLRETYALPPQGLSDEDRKAPNSTPTDEKRRERREKRRQNKSE